MTARIAYISGTDRGGRIVGLRLVGPHTDESWTVPDEGSLSLGHGNAASAAAWINERLKAAGKSRDLAALCLDIDGAVCSWVTSPEADPSMIQALIEGVVAEGSTLDADDHGPGAGGRFPDLPGELSYEPLAEASAKDSKHRDPDHPLRIPVLAVPDVQARLLLDELDRLGVRVDRSISLWHAAGIAWDPSGPGARGGSGLRSERVVADSAVVTAVVLLDHDAGRLVWSWSLSGALVAAGSIRLAKAAVQTEDRGPAADRMTRQSEAVVVVSDADLARLSADWLAWSAQTGASPSRLVWVGTPGDGLDEPALADALGRACPGISLGFVDEPDPVGATLERLASADRLEPSLANLAESRSRLPTLSRRSGRAHQSMYRWAAAAMVLAAAVIGSTAWRLFGAADQTKAARAELLVQRRALLQSVDPTLVLSPLPVRELDARVQAASRSSFVPEGLRDPRPVLKELDTISMVIGQPGIDLTEIFVNQGRVIVQCVTPDLTSAEQIDFALRSIVDTQLTWVDPRRQQRDRAGVTRIECTFTAQWPKRTTGGQP